MALNLESCDSLPPDEEPKLKYDRMGNDVQNILLKDAVSCICVHTKFICLGTQWGVIHLLDHEGNTVPIGGAEGNGKELQAHAVAVNRISVDAHGEYFASCSDDGRVLVRGLYSPDNAHTLTLGRQVKSVALDPNYYKSGSGRRFLTGLNLLIFILSAHCTGVQIYRAVSSRSGVVKKYKNTDNCSIPTTNINITIVLQCTKDRS